MSRIERLPDALTAETGGKIVLLVADGLGGLPHPETGLTELETAKTPNLDALVADGATGLHVPIASGITPGSGPAHMGLFGYDPVEYLIGRGVLEALGIGFDLREGDVAVRINFATVDADGIITDRRAGRIPNDKCEELSSRLDAIELPGVELFFRPVKEHRAVLVLRGDGLAGDLGDTDPQATGVPPLAVVAERPEEERTAGFLNAFIAKARELLADQPQANAITMRGIAERTRIPTFPERYHLRSAAIAGYPMYRGVAGLVGMDVLPIAGTPGDMTALLAEHWESYDFFFMHFKRTDSTGEDGDFAAKVAATEEFDTVVPGVRAVNPDVLLVTGDHSTPAVLASHSWHPVPVALAAAHIRRDANTVFGETACLAGSLGRMRAIDLMPLMLAHAGRLAKFGA
ncbi:2,3-bisphosphoglycerate-independent phosphoglycerate mutase [bacterium]|nr:2,3-bisphosphoglycerate-independent phosphoglycerate mutase [bacterium]